MWLLLLGVLVLLVVLGVVAFVVWDKSFRNTARIARQTGNDINDVIWVNTRFKVIHEGGSWKIVFRHLREKTNSVEGRFWTKFYKPGTEISMTKQQWEQKDMSRLLQRGLLLYETSEGVFFPMSINFSGGSSQLKIIDQENRMFLTNEIANTNELTKDKKNETLKIVAIVIGLVLIAGVAIGTFYMLNAEGQRNIAATAQVCGDYARAVFNVTMNGGTTYVGSIPYPGG
jgi:hypothetical protein